MAIACGLSLWLSARAAVPARPDSGAGAHPPAQPGGAPVGADSQAILARALEALDPDTGSPQAEGAIQRQQEIQRLLRHAGRPGAETEREAAAIAVVTKLGAEQRPAVRVWLLRQLATLGRTEAVPVEAALLDDADPWVREQARQALVANPAPESTAPLITALGQAHTDEWRVAILNGLGYRRDPAATATLIGCASDTSEAVRAAALGALADLGTITARSALATARTTGTDRSRQQATAAYLRLAERLGETGEPATARAMFAEFLKSPLPELRCAALLGMARCGGVSDLPVLEAGLADSDPQVRGAALNALRTLPGPEATAALGRHSRVGTPEMRQRVLRAVVDRHDPAGGAFLLDALADPAAEVRRVAIAGCGELAVPAAAEHLATMLTEAEPEEAAAVSMALGRIPGEPVTAALCQRLRKTGAPGRAALVEALKQRHSPAATQALLEACRDPDAAVRKAALAALRADADLALLPQAISLLTDATTDDRPEVEGLLVALGQAAPSPAPVNRALLASLAASSGPAHGSVLRVLGRLGGAPALEAVTAALAHAEPEIRTAAVRALADWPDAQALESLLSVARDSPEQVCRVLALRGYARLLAQETGLPHRTRLARYRDGLDAAQRPEEIRVMLAGVAELPTRAAAILVARYLGVDAVRMEAATVIDRIARALATSSLPEADAVLGLLETADPDSGPAAIAAQARQWIEAGCGHICEWQVCGPYALAGRTGTELFDIAFPPERRHYRRLADLKWVPLAPGLDANRPWGLSLARALGGADRVAYLRTYVWSPEEQETRLEVGSDDGLKVWLNQKLVFANRVSRSLRAREDSVVLCLTYGWNVLLLKVTQNQGDWAASAALGAADGTVPPGIESVADARLPSDPRNTDGDEVDPPQ